MTKHKEKHEHNHDYTATVKDFPETGEVEITGEISASEFDASVKETLKMITKEIVVAGFRKGQAPEKMIREKVGESALLYDAAEDLLQHMLPHIFDEKNIDTVGSPKITITKLAEKNPLGFLVRIAVMPTIKFDYKKIAKKFNESPKEKVEVSEKDINETLDKVLKSRAGEGKEPEALTDEVAKTLGEFKSVADLKENLKENLAKEREFRNAEKRRIAMFDVLIETAKITIPTAMTDAELERMIHSFKGDVKRMGLSFDDYLKSIKKTEDDMKKDWLKDATKRVATELILDYVAKEEPVIVSPKKVEEETEVMLSHYKDVDPMRARAYVEELLTREETIKFLETIA